VISSICNPAFNHLHGGHNEPPCCAFDGTPEVLGETTVAAKPCEYRFQDPAPWDHDDAFGLVGALYDLHRPSADFGECCSQFLARITAISEDIPQPLIAVADGGQHTGRSVAVLHIGSIHDCADQKALCVSDDMQFSASELFARVIARNPATFGGFDQLAVDQAYCGAGLTTCSLTCQHRQRMVDRGPQTGVAPTIEIVLHHGHGREYSGWKRAPREPAMQQKQQRFNDLPMAP
jgi:hypothetical protein